MTTTTRPAPRHEPTSRAATTREAAARDRPAIAKAARQRTIRELVARLPIGSQQELADALNARGMAVTQATVSRDIAELGLVKVPRADGHVYVPAGDLGGSSPAPSDALLRRLLADIPISIGRSGLILVLTGTPGTASSIAQAIDESSLSEQEGTLAGDNTLLVLFADEARLELWLAGFTALQAVGATTPPAGISSRPSIAAEAVTTDRQEVPR